MGLCFSNSALSSSHHSEIFKYQQQTNKHTAADLLGEGWSFYHKICSVSFTCAFADASVLLPGTFCPFPATCSLPLSPLCSHTHTHIFFLIHCDALFRGHLTLPLLGQHALPFWSPLTMSLSSASSTHRTAHQTVFITLNCTCLFVLLLHPKDSKLCKGPYLV